MMVVLGCRRGSEDGLGGNEFVFAGGALMLDNFGNVGCPTVNSEAGGGI